MRWPRGIAVPAAALLLVACTAPPALAQWASVARMVYVGSEAAERVRLQQLTDTASDSAPDPTFLFRSASSLSRRVERNRRVELSLIAPEWRTVYNSAIPYSPNNGALWAGRGTSALATAGVRMHVGPVRVIVAPEITTSENRPFQVIPYPAGGGTAARSVWANPFHPSPSSIDLPYRFGDQPRQRTTAGQSSVSVDLPWLTTGVATENLWWGPGTNNAIVLSNNAEGFPHAFVQTRDGIDTPIGRFDAQWITGVLRESDFFDRDSTNNRRTISGVIAVWTPSFDRRLSIGAARTVTAPVTGRSLDPTAAVDVFTRVGQPNTKADHVAIGARPDQLLSVFGRFVFPGAGAEAYVEWARFAEPTSVRDLIEYPGHSQGYTVGLQWARAVSRLGTLRLAAEATQLEPDASIRVRPVATSYTSRAMPQGYTHRGQVLGAAIGPGSSSQAVSADLFGAHFRVGGFAGRIRWDNATLWEPIVPQVKLEDISLLGGVRASVTVRGVRLLAEYTATARLDYLYQDKVTDYARGTHGGVDIGNRTLSVSLSTHVGR